MPSARLPVAGDAVVARCSRCQSSPVVVAASVEAEDLHVYLRCPVCLETWIVALLQVDPLEDGWRLV